MAQSTRPQLASAPNIAALRSEEQITDVVTLDNIVFDVDEPTGTITLDENNSWDSLLKTITFGLFFKTEKNVTIEANDAGSGVKSVEYCVSKEEIEKIRCRKKENRGA